MNGKPSTYGIGFASSLILTFTAFFIATGGLFSKFTIDFSVAILTVLQALFFLLTFFGMQKEKKPHWNLTVFLFMLLVTVLLVIGSVWIMYHLNYNLMGT